MFTFTWTGTEIDEEVFSFEISQAEGEFATLRIEIRNPHVGLLRPGAALWATLADEAGQLFYGRLVGIPEDLFSEIVTLSFIARPDNHDEQKRDLAYSLKVAPFYDPMWYAEDRRNDPDTALEARPAIWHTDRVTHILTASDIISGEDGTYVMGDEDWFYDSLTLSLANVPASQITCTATVSWSQRGEGNTDLSKKILGAFGGKVKSYTGEGLISDWPKSGNGIGAGWEVGQGTSAKRTDRASNTQLLVVQLADGSQAGFPMWTASAKFFAAYKYSRQRRETIKFTLVADTQAIVSDPREEEILEENVTSSELDKAIDAPNSVSGLPPVPANSPYASTVARYYEGNLGPVGPVPHSMPIWRVNRATFFDTDRGYSSFDHLIVRCRTKLLARARCVHISAQATFDVVRQLSLRHSVTLTDDRIPGGTATGKVISYSLTANGDTGEVLGSVAIACTVGKGGSVAVPASVPADAYVVDGYTSGEWAASGETGTVLVTNDISYTKYTITDVAEDGLNTGMLDDPNYVVLSCAVVNGVGPQEVALDKTFEDVQAAISALNEVYTQVALSLRPLEGGPYEYHSPFIPVSPFVIPKTIDLEAAS